MPRPFIRRLKKLSTTKHNKYKYSGSDAYFQVLLKFHDSILSITKSLFACMFVFAATPIAILAGKDFKQYKNYISYITSMIGEMMVICLFLFAFYILFTVYFEYEFRNSKYLVKRLKYMNTVMASLSCGFLLIAMVRYFMCFSYIIKTL